MNVSNRLRHTRSARASWSGRDYAQAPRRLFPLAVILGVVAPAIGLCEPCYAFAQQPADEKPSDNAPEATQDEASAAPEQAASGPMTAASFTTLADPAVAERLKLSDEQRKRIAEILQIREQTLEKAEPDQRATIEAQFEKQLRDVLTTEQLDQWAVAARTANVPTEKKLQFNFRFQPWIDVLTWFAHQADLSLVLDAPPPGTFNYTDSRAYSVSEALDLLNGVLLTKGYTLIRRGHMLMLANLADGLPLDLIPTISPEELDQRGQFEMVRVSIPLGGRNPDEVRAEIEPLVGPHGKIDVLPKTGQVIVVDVASRVRTIRAVIDSMPVPQKPAPKPQPQPEKPVLQTYPAGKIDAEAALEAFKALLPDAKIVYDAKTSQFVAYAVPSQQAALKKALEQLQAERPPEQRPVLRTYDVRHRDTAKLLEVIRMVAPEVQTTLDNKHERLVVFATPPQHQAIEQAIDELDQAAETVGDVVLKVYALKHTTPATLQSALASLFPDARIAVDVDTRRLLVAAKAPEQQAIGSMIAQLDAPTPDGRQLQIFSFDPRMASTLQSVLNTLVPKALVTVDSQNGRLVAIAEPDDLQKIETTITRLGQSAAEQEKPAVKVYTVSPDLRARVVEVLNLMASDLPGMRVITPGQGARDLTVWATPQQHEIVAELIERLRAQESDQAQLRVASYAIRYADPQSVLSVLQTLLPHVQLVLDAKNSRITARARPEELQTIEAAIQQMDVEMPKEKQLKLLSHPLNEADSSLVMNVLSTLLPNVRVLQDNTTKSLVVWGRDQDQQVVHDVIERLQPTVDPARRPVMQVYTVRDADPRVVLEILRNALPEVRAAADPGSGKLAVWATPQQQELVKATVEGMKNMPRPEDRRRIAVYRLQHSDPSSVAAVLRQTLPDVRLAVDSTAGHLIAWAKEDEHRALREAIDEIEAAATEQGGRTIAVYPLEQNAASNLISVIRPGVPRATLTYDSTNRNLIAWADAHDQELIRQAVERLEKDVVTQPDQRLVVYPLKHNTASSVISAIQPSVPKARLTYDSTNTNLLAFATEKEHETIRQAVEQIENEIGQANQQTVASYPLRKNAASTLVSLLQPAVPKARLTYDPTNSILIAWANEADQETIRQAVQRLEADTPEANPPKLVVYPLKHNTASSVISAIQPSVPKARLTYDSTNTNLLAFATEKEHETIRQAVEQIENEIGQANEQQTVASYPLRKNAASTLVSLLQPAVPKARLTYDPTNTVLIAWANETDQEIIRQAVQRLEADTPEANPPKLVVYPLKHNTASSVISAIQPSVPKARLTYDSTNTNLLAFATEKEHETIRQAVDEIETRVREASERTAVVYALGDVEPSTAIAMVRAQAPTSQYASDPRSKSLVVWARAEEHEQIKKTLEKLREGLEAAPTKTTEVYRFTAADPVDVSRAVRTLFPSAEVAADRGNRTLLVTATPEEQQRIAEIVEQVQKKTDVAQGTSVKVYVVRQADPVALERTLRNALPRASIAGDRSTHTLTVWATDAEHEIISQAIEQFESGIPADNRPQIVAYPLKDVDATSAQQLLTNAYPQARFSLDRISQSLIVWATPQEHEAIKQAIEQIQSTATATGGLKTRVYRFRNATPSTAISALRVLLPNATMAVDAATSSLVVTATPQQHEQIREAIAQLEGEGSDNQAPQLKAYSIRGADPQSVLSVLRDLFANRTEVRLSLDAEHHRLIAWAMPEQHETIRTTLKEMEAVESPESTAQVEVYPLGTADPAAVEEVFADLFRDQPGVRIVVDRAQRQAVAVASPSQQATIRATIQQMQGPSRQFEVIPLRVVDPFAAAAAINRLFDVDQRKPSPWDPIVEADYDNPQLLVRATKEDLGKIRDLLAKMGEIGVTSIAGQEGRNFRVLPMSERTARQVIEEVQRIWSQIRPNPIRVVTPSAVAPTMREQRTRENSKPAGSRDGATQQAPGGASPGRKSATKPPANKPNNPNKPLEKPEAEKPSADSGAGGTPSREGGRGDEGSSGSGGSQHDDKPGGASATAFGPKGVARHHDVLQPIVLTAQTSGTRPSAKRSRLLFDAEHLLAMADTAETAQGQPPAVASEKRTPSASTESEPSASSASQSQSRSQSPASAPPDARADAENKPDAEQPSPQSEAAKKNAPTSTAEQRPAESASKTNESKQPATQPAASDHADRKAPGPPPIVVAPGPSGLTIASDDKEALEQFEQLLRAILERRGSGGREFTIFQLRNANAAVVADTLQKLFESAGAFRGGFGAGLSIVPDPRLNALIVQGNRNDLAAIENLVKVLDTSEVPETLVANRPKLIPLKNARADEVADVLRDVYREQMRPKSRSQLPVPRGVSRDLAQVLQSINAQNTGPGLTVGVDEDSNSLVVAAAPPLLNEVEQLVQRLDETAERLTRSVRVISLEKTNAETVQDALRMLLPEIKTRRGRRRSR